LFDKPDQKRIIFNEILKIGRTSPGIARFAVNCAWQAKMKKADSLWEPAFIAAG